MKGAMFGIGLGVMIAGFLAWKFWPLALLAIFLIALGRVEAGWAKRREEDAKQ